MAENIPAFHVMAKPAGAQCNCVCDYCFFLKKERLYPGSDFRMSGEVLESYIRQIVEAHRGVNEVTVAWQGGEPTLMGLDFFLRSIELEKKYAPASMRIENTIQTNGVLIDEEWCRFLKENNFLVGISIDGPRHLHDAFRRDKAGKPVYDKVVNAVHLMQKHGVEFNVLCTINAENSRYPLEVYRFFRDELKAQYIQFIPIVERDNETGNQEGTAVTGRTVEPEQFGRFLIEIFDEWVRRDVGSTFVLNFDGALAGWLGHAGTVCIFGPTCGLGVALEHNGDVYSCDHFVEPGHYLGNILKTPLAELVASEKQRGFGQGKKTSLPRICQECEFLRICNGECPRNRLFTTADGETGLNYLCAGYKAFFAHADKSMRIMADLLRRNRPASEVMAMLAQKEKDLTAGMTGSARNDPCPCGSGKKYKLCHGR
jgi:uncharacterized protein